LVLLKVDFLPWQRSKKTAQQNQQYVGVYPAWATDTFAGALLSPTIDCSQVALFTQQDSAFNFNSMEETFRDYIVGIVSTYGYPENIQRLIDKYPHNISRVKDERSMIRMLAAKRSHVAISETRVVEYISEKNNITNLKFVVHLSYERLVIAFKNTPSNAQRLKRLKKILAQPNNVDRQAVCSAQRYHAS